MIHSDACNVNRYTALQVWTEGNMTHRVHLAHRDRVIQAKHYGYAETLLATEPRKARKKRARRSRGVLPLRKSA